MKQLATSRVPTCCDRTKSITPTLTETAEQRVRRAFATPGIFRGKLSVERIPQATAIVVRACGLETVLPSTHAFLIMATRAMPDASPFIELERLSQAEVVAFNKAVDDYIRSGCVQPQCEFTEICRRMNIIRNVSNCKHVYGGWRTVAQLVETWSERDLWEAAAITEISEKAAWKTWAAGQASNVMFMFSVVEEDFCLNGR